jgi:hypothetical protein
MKISIRSMLALSVIAVVLSACAAAAAPSTSEAPPSTPPPSVAPSETPSETPAGPSESPEETPDASPTVVGTLTVADGAVVDGPGEPLADVLAGDLSQPVFVRGTVFRDTDGQIYFADSLTDASVPTFGNLRVRVANYPTDGPTWDMANADLIGLQEANGVRFFADTKLYGTISQ